MAPRQTRFSAINNRIELTNLNHGTTARRWHQFANCRQFNAKLGGCSFDLIFCFRMTASSKPPEVCGSTADRALHAAFHPSDDRSWQSYVQCRQVLRPT
ncbi:Uncharacterised protein [Escherichia coli]|uniref:Uncharacterized protein n=1 Tax=Escherichia coli TaxID=562 RepID=A0A2X1QC69_ECOLX|nr:Uncharacterised protein [Escherichia coli]